MGVGGENGGGWGGGGRLKEKRLCWVTSSSPVQMVSSRPEDVTQKGERD